jgi:beta-glucosidase
MSLSWSRIIPDGSRGSPVNMEGVKFYRQVIQCLLDNGIVRFCPPAVLLALLR